MSGIGPNSSRRVSPDIDESGGQLLEGSVKNSDLIIQPGAKNSKDSINSQAENSDDDEELLDEEELLELQRKEMEKEKLRRIAEKKEKALQKKRKRIMCCQKFCCFKDEIKAFDFD